MKVFITGGSGFIGSHLVRRSLADGHDVLNYDLLTYAANPLSLLDCADNARYHFVQGDVCDTAQLVQAIQTFAPDIVVHCAAETHVDRSIQNASPFTRTNVLGTQSVLDALLAYNKPNDYKAIFISTDEVFGSLTETDKPFNVESAYAPRSPYAASKAAADHLVRAYIHTYQVPAIITNCSNNYGPCQFPEKLIPHMVLNALAEKPMPLYGNGQNIRDWIHVEDHVDALLTVATEGDIGATYLIGGDNEQTNQHIVQFIATTLDKLKPRQSGSYQDLITYVTDRPGHDKRYAVTADSTKALGWQPNRSFTQGLSATIQWYMHNESWVAQALQQNNGLNRIGQKWGGL